MSTWSSRLVSQTVLALPLAAAFVWAGSQALALRTAVDANTAAMQAPPTAVAVVDIDKVMKENNANATWRTKFDALVAKAKTDEKARADKISALQESAKGVTDVAQLEALRDTVGIKQLELQEWRKIKTMEVDRELSLMRQSMFRAVKTEAEKVAKSEGYQLVLIDDSNVEIGSSDQQNASREMQVSAQISMTRILYVDKKAIDITERVIVRLNNMT